MYIKYLHFTCLTQFSDVYTILYKASFSPGSVQQIMHYSLDTRTVVHVTAAKYKPLIFSVLDVALSIIANILIFINFEWFPLFAYTILLCKS
jgi:hypothetical protein